MRRSEAATERQAKFEGIVTNWARDRSVDLGRFDVGQKWVIFAALQAMQVVGSLPPLRRLLAYVLGHSGMGLNSEVIAAITGVGGRSIRSTRRLSPKELLHSVRTPESGHRPRKLGPERAGVLAKFLVEHPRCLVDDILAYIASQLDVSLDRKTLREYMKKYGLGCLRGNIHADGPLFSALRSTEAPFS